MSLDGLNRESSDEHSHKQSLMDVVGKLAAEHAQKQSLMGMFSTTLLHFPFIVHFRECHSKSVACDMFHKRYNVTHNAKDCPMPPKKTTTLNLRVDPAIK